MSEAAKALRDARAAAIGRLRVALADNYEQALPRLLDDLDAIDRERQAAAIAETVIPPKTTTARRKAREA